MEHIDLTAMADADIESLIAAASAVLAERRRAQRDT